MTITGVAETVATAHEYERAMSGSPTVRAYIARYGRWMPEAVAHAVVREHALEPSEVLDEVLWTGPYDATGGATRVAVAHLFAVLGY